MNLAMELQAAIDAHLACAKRIDESSDVALAVIWANEMGDRMEDLWDIVCWDRVSLESRVNHVLFGIDLCHARRVMNESLRSINQRSLRAGQERMIDETLVFARNVLARIPQIMEKPRR